jgi:hypothetical protein
VISKIAGAFLGTVLSFAFYGTAIADETPTTSLAGQPYSQQQRDYVAMLNKLLDAQDYNQLTQKYLRLNESHQMLPLDDNLVVPALDWGKSGTLAGKSVAVPLLYSTLLWRVGSAYQQHTDLKITSGLMAMYALLVTYSDGQKCADKTAVSHRIDMISSQYVDSFKEIAALSEDQKKTLT